MYKILFGVCALLNYSVFFIRPVATEEAKQKATSKACALI